MSLEKRKTSFALQLVSDLGSSKLFSQDEAGQLAALFKVLANDTRLRILHALSKEDELCVSDISKFIGLAPAGVSNQLQKLSLQGIVDSRRDKNNIYYKISDPCVLQLLSYGHCLSRDSHTRNKV